MMSPPYQSICNHIQRDFPGIRFFQSDEEEAYVTIEHQEFTDVPFVFSSLVESVDLRVFTTFVHEKYSASIHTLHRQRERSYVMRFKRQPRQVSDLEHIGCFSLQALFIGIIWTLSMFLGVSTFFLYPYNRPHAI